MLSVACHSGRFTQRCMGPNSCTVLYSIQACPLVPQWSSNTACHRCNIPHMHAQARSSPPGLCTPHDRSGRSLLQWLPTEWSACPIECGARCTQHRDYQCRCIYFIEHGSWDLAKRFSEDICTRSIRSHGGVARRSEPNFTAAWRDRTLRAATGLRAQDNGELGADDHTLRRAARLQCCTVHVVSQPAHRRPPSPPHMRFGMACFGSADLGCTSESVALDRLATEWGACSVTCGVGKQQRLVRFASELCFRALACAPLDVARPAPSSTHGIRLVLPAVARLQRYGTRFGVPLLWSIMAGWPASPPAINSALLPSTAP